MFLALTGTIGCFEGSFTRLSYPVEAWNVGYLIDLR